MSEIAPPATSTLPLSSRVALCCARAVTMEPVDTNVAWADAERMPSKAVGSNAKTDRPRTIHNLSNVRFIGLPPISGLIYPATRMRSHSRVRKTRIGSYAKSGNAPETHAGNSANSHAPHSPYPCVKHHACQRRLELARLKPRRALSCGNRPHLTRRASELAESKNRATF